jgi:hypothetical protein
MIHFVEQGECGERYVLVSFAVMGVAHRVIVSEGYEADARRADAVLHGQGNGGDAPYFNRVADQPDGPVAKGSGRGEKYNVHLVFYQLVGDFGGRIFYQRGRIVDGSHKGEVTRRQFAHRTIADQSKEGPEGKDCVQVAVLVRPVVCVGPGEVVGGGWDLTVGAIACRVVDIEARLVGQVDAARGDEREARSIEGFLRFDERLHRLRL